MTDNRTLVAAFAAADISHSGFQFARCYENQRHFPFAGWTDKMLPTDRDPWSDESGNVKLERDSLNAPPKCKWCGSWEAVVEPGVTDNEGWMYATGNFLGPYKAKNYTLSLCRRRQWRRPFRLVSSGERDQILATGIADDAREVASGAAAVIAASVANSMVQREWDVISNGSGQYNNNNNNNKTPTSSAPPASQSVPEQQQQQSSAQKKDDKSTFDSIASIFGFGAGGKKIPTEEQQQPAAAAATTSNNGLAPAPPKPGQQEQQQQQQHKKKEDSPEKFDSVFGNPNAQPLEPGKAPTHYSSGPDPFASAFDSSSNNNKSDFMSANERSAAAASAAASSSSSSSHQQQQQNNSNATGMVKEDSLFGNPNKPLFGSNTSHGGGGGSPSSSIYSGGSTLGSSHASQQKAHQPSLFGAVDNAPIHGAQHHQHHSSSGGDSLFGSVSNAPVPTAASSYASQQQQHADNKAAAAAGATAGGGHSGGDSLFASSGSNREEKRESDAHDNVDDLLSKFM